MLIFSMTRSTSGGSTAGVGPSWSSPPRTQPTCTSRHAPVGTGCRDGGSRVTHGWTEERPCAIPAAHEYLRRAVRHQPVVTVRIDTGCRVSSSDETQAGSQQDLLELDRR